MKPSQKYCYESEAILKRHAIPHCGAIHFCLLQLGRERQAELSEFQASQVYRETLPFEGLFFLFHLHIFEYSLSIKNQLVLYVSLPLCVYGSA